MEDNSIRSLFKISEESLAHNSHNVIRINEPSMPPSKQPKSKNPSKKKRTSKKQNNTQQQQQAEPPPLQLPPPPPPPPLLPQISKSSNNLILDVANIEFISTHSAKSVNSVNSYFDSNKPENTHESIYKTKKASTTTPGAFKSNMVRRAQSDLTFNLFEKLIKKAKLNQNDDISRTNISTQENNKYSLNLQSNNLNKRSNLNNLNYDDYSNKAINSFIKQSYYSRYKNDSESIEKRLNYLKYNSSSVLNENADNKKDSIDSISIKNSKTFNWTSWKRLGKAKSFHNLLSSGYNLVDIKSTGFLPISQHIQQQDLKQFKSTLECVELLRKKNKKRNKLKVYQDNKETRFDFISSDEDSDNEFNLARIKQRFMEYKKQIETKETDKTKNNFIIDSNSLILKQSSEDIRENLNPGQTHSLILNLDANSGNLDKQNKILSDSENNFLNNSLNDTFLTTNTSYVIAVSDKTEFTHEEKLSEYEKQGAIPKQRATKEEPDAKQSDQIAHRKRLNRQRPGGRKKNSTSSNKSVLSNSEQASSAEPSVCQAWVNIY